MSEMLLISMKPSGPKKTRLQSRQPKSKSCCSMRPWVACQLSCSPPGMGLEGATPWNRAMAAIELSGKL